MTEEIELHTAADARSFWKRLPLYSLVQVKLVDEESPFYSIKETNRPNDLRLIGGERIQFKFSKIDWIEVYDDWDEVLWLPEANFIFFYDEELNRIFVCDKTNKKGFCHTDIGLEDLDFLVKDLEELLKFEFSCYFETSPENEKIVISPSLTIGCTAFHYEDIIAFLRIFG